MMVSGCEPSDAKRREFVCGAEAGPDCGAAGAAAKRGAADRGGAAVRADTVAGDGRDAGEDHGCGELNIWGMAGGGA